MDLFSSLTVSLRTLPVLLLGLVGASGVVAQTEITSEYIYIGFEAEDHIAKNERWVTTTPSTPTGENDPDGNHSDQASGSTYLELLPDMRVTHDDTFGPPTAYWGQGGQGPDADYVVDFPEPGRYYVHVRAYSTGTEDNGIHIGIDGTWPASGQRMQFCTASRRAWWWSSAQRDAGGNGSCGIEKSIWLDVDTAGEHTVSISAREDGFEIDRLVLMKDLSGNTRLCEPVNISGVSCRDGSIGSADEFVDLRVRLESEVVGADPEEEVPNPLEVDLGETIELTANIENLDEFDTATEIVLTLSTGTDEWTMLEMDNRCAQEGDEFVCNLDELHPTAPNEYAPFEFTMQANVGGDLRIDAGLVSAQIDHSPANDVAASIIKVIGEGTPVETTTDMKLSMQTDVDEYELNQLVRVSARLANLGTINADEVSYRLEVPVGLKVNSATLPAVCTAQASVECNFESIESARSELVNIDLLAAQAGVYTLSASVTSANDSNISNNFDSDSLVVNEPVVETTTEGSVTEGETTMATTTEGSTTEGEDDSATTDAGSTGSATGDGSDTQGETAGSTDSASSTVGDTGSQTTDAVSDDTESGALTIWFVLLLLVLYSARFYGGHQRQRVAIRQ